MMQVIVLIPVSATKEDEAEAIDTANKLGGPLNKMFAGRTANYYYANVLDDHHAELFIQNMMPLKGVGGAYVKPKDEAPTSVAPL